ncbi:MAG: hypothetical protein DCC43_00160 [Candidatus Brocadia sp.]|jgi:hypothetical protein|uniref:Uncharacterized protein n=1 Tax=Candidatus Brocadia fulgida TaxID=380242 RepID=A0A0M2UTH8_9BACT|nr:MAG: hypothetical protein BROFUL_03023 [Candidatus Brocadia fulgida]MCC6324904.1 hypothetical protein [Candidatus Brocadia sp.]MBV6517568.1 hypothetical protein [Candidatus Brocadia fulgida]MDG5996183.1 hypothetical protein [Candidatus Brocadia sp.]RIK03442.1 MAG: hypothetical protein DCC43_00160 [Candidatus Brocadia sp.]
MDDMRLAREDRPLLCTSVQRVVAEHKGEGSFAFDKNKRKRKEGKMREKTVAPIKHESVMDKQGIEENYPKTHEEDDQDGNIVDIEA